MRNYQGLIPSNFVEIGAASGLEFCVFVAPISLKGGLAHVLVQSTNILITYFGLDEICMASAVRAFLKKGCRFVTSTFLRKQTKR